MPHQCEASCGCMGPLLGRPPRRPAPCRGLSQGVSQRRWGRMSSTWGQGGELAWGTQLWSLGSWNSAAPSLGSHGGSDHLWPCSVPHAAVVAAEAQSLGPASSGSGGPVNGREEAEPSLCDCGLQDCCGTPEQAKGRVKSRFTRGPHGKRGDPMGSRACVHLSIPLTNCGLS